MRADTQQEVAELRSAPGELSFLARVGGLERRVSFRAEGGPTAEGADAALATCLIPAMRAGGALSLPGPVSPRLLRSQRELQAVLRAWSLDWDFFEQPLEEVDVDAPARIPAAPQTEGRVAAFFSGGVDSWSTLLANRDVTDLIFVRGFDLPPAGDDRLAGEVEARVREVADARGLTLHTVETDLRALSDPLTPWDVYFPSASMAVAHFLAPRFDRVLLANSMDHETDERFGTGYLIDHLWSSERLETVDDGGRYSRVQRTARIASHPLVRRTLRVCWENRDRAYNCGRCRKCLMTRITLEALDARAGFETFPAELDLGDVAAIEIEQPVLLTLWEDVLDAIREAGRADLEPAVEAAVEKGRLALGLPPTYRRRRQPGPPPLRNAPAALAELLESRSWKLTAPLRWAGSVLRRLRRRG